MLVRGSVRVRGIRLVQNSKYLSFNAYSSYSQFPVKVGSRFSKNAAIPSLWSSV